MCCLQEMKDSPQHCYWISPQYCSCVYYCFITLSKSILCCKEVNFPRGTPDIDYIFKLMATLREECKERLKVALDSVRAVSNTLTFILIVDKYGLKVLSNTIKTMELINYGITLVERLELKRKKISKMEAVYLISPDSLEEVMNDFPENDDPQYRSVHILTLSKITEQQMEGLGENGSLTKRLKTLKEINFNYSLHSHNEVRLCAYDDSSFTRSIQKTNSIHQSTVDELSTILTSMSQFYIVQIYYQRSRTGIAQFIATGLKERFEKVFKKYEKEGVQNYNTAASVVTFLILEREFDVVSPLVRDYHYLPLLYDLRDVKGHKIVDEKKTFALDENDQIMEKYKHAHFSAVLKGISADFTAFSQSHAALRAKGEEVNMQQMGEALKKMPEYIELKDRYQLHYEALQQLLKIFETKGLKAQGFLEQSLLSLTNEDNKKVKEKDLLASLQSMLEKTAKPQERAKLALIGLLCLELKPKEQTAIAETLNKTPYKGIESVLPLLAGPQIYRLNPKKENKGNQVLDRHLPRIQETMRSLISGDQGQLRHLRVGTAEKGAKLGQKSPGAALGLKKIRIQTERKDRPKLVVFMNSALGYNQMRCLAEFQSSHQLIYASHNFVTHNQYLNLLKGLAQSQQQPEL